MFRLFHLILEMCWYLHQPSRLCSIFQFHVHFVYGFSRVGTRVHAALEKMTSQYLKKEFRSSARRFLEEFTSTVLSTVAARSKLCQAVGCFCLEIIIGGDGHSAFFLLGQFLDGLISCGWEKGSTFEACKADFQCSVNDQRQLESHASRRHSDYNNFVGDLIHQSGFRSRRHLYPVILVGLQFHFFAVMKRKLYCEFQVFQLTTLFQRGPVEKIPRFELNLDRVTISRRSIDSAICCVQSFVRDPLFTQRDFFTDNGISMLLGAVNIAGGVCEESVYDPRNVILPEGYAAVAAHLRMAYDVVCLQVNFWGTFSCGFRSAPRFIGCFFRLYCDFG